MPNVNDIANLAEALEKHPVIALDDRCVAVRNRNASCRKCVQACPFGALAVEANEITLDATLCVGCGVCIGVCPTEALVSFNAPDDSLLDAASGALKETPNVAIIACARIASKRLADPAKYIEVPCIARVEESLILEIAADGAKEIALVDGTCKTCKYRDCMAGIEITIEQVRALIDASGGSCEIGRASTFPNDILVEDTTGLYGSTRRGFLSDAVGAARETALIAAKTTLEQELGIKPEQISIGERFRVTDSGSLPTIACPRHDRLLNAFDALGEPVCNYLSSRRFATVEINADRCNSCGMCAVFCPTGALRRNPSVKLSDPIEHIEFSSSECVNCKLCKDVCWKGALTIENGVSIEQLYDFEPRVFELSHPAKKKSRFGSF